MRKILASVFGGAALFAAICGAAPANAGYEGLTYAQAVEYMSAHGGTAIIATREGSYLPTEQCIIVRSRDSGSKTYLDLNCNDIVSGEHPGNSVATPAGAKAKTLRTQSENISKDYAKAIDSGKSPWCDNYMSYCKSVCKQSGTCSSELLEYIGS